MKLTKRRGIAALLTFALALSGVAIPSTGGVSNAEETGAVAPTSQATSGSAAAIESLKTYFDSIWNADHEKQPKVRIQGQEQTELDEQLDAFAYNTLYAANPKLKFAQYAVDKNYGKELFALQAGKKLSIYDYDAAMPGVMANTIKPAISIKNVKEVRKGSTKKATFFVKTVKGKTTSYAQYKLSGAKFKKSTEYSKTGKKYKKGSKKTTKKAFNKFVKTYNKAKKLSFKAPNEYAQFYNNTDYSFMSPETYVYYHQDTDYKVILLHDKDSKTDPYKAYAYASGNAAKTRFVLGKNEASDWEKVREENFNPMIILTILNSLLKTPNEYSVSKKDTQDPTLEEYDIVYDNGDDSESDFYYEIIVNKDLKRFESICIMQSVGSYLEKLLFFYGDDANVDGELYEPGSDAEAYADPDYVASTGEKVRTLTVDYAGTKKEIKTCGDYRFEPWTDSAKGTFTLTDGTKTYDWMSLNLDSDEWNAANKLLNPDSGDTGGYGAPTATLTWTAK